MLSSLYEVVSNHCYTMIMMKLTLVDISLSVVGGLILLVEESVLASGGTASEGCIAVLGDSLVGLLAGLSSSAISLVTYFQPQDQRCDIPLDSLRDVVSGVLDGLHFESLFVCLFGLVVVLCG